MNAFKLIISKAKVKYLYDTDEFEQGMEILKQSGYTAIPVIRVDGTYAGTVCDKDFLLKYTDEDTKNYDGLLIKDIIRQDWNPAINISSGIKDLLL